MPQGATTHDNTALSEDDRRLLKCCIQGKWHSAIFAVLVVLLFPSLTVICVYALADSGSSGTDRELRIVAFLTGCVAFGMSIFIGRNVTRMVRSWMRIHQLVQGGHKRIVSGTLKTLEQATHAGVRYVLEDRSVDVALPGWNEILTDTRYGTSPRAAAARSGAMVRLHLLDILPESQPLLLRAEYADAPVLHTEAPLSDEDRLPRAKATSRARTILMVMAAAFLVFAAILPPLFFVSVLIALVALLPVPGEKQLAMTQVKHIVSGTIDETLTFHVGDAPYVQVHCYRIGGELYRVPSERSPSAPGQPATVEYVGQGEFGTSVLLFTAKDAVPIHA